MFDETNKYKNKGHFFLNPGDDLSTVSSDVPDLPVVYYVMRLADGGVDMVYIGSSGSIDQKGRFSNLFLNEMKRQQFFEEKIFKEKIDALDIYWFVTFDEQHHDLPGYVEGKLMQRYFDLYGTLPSWNKKYPSERGV